MPAFIEECRYEWKRLGVPDSMADEMATELEADLAEAEADGVSAAEILGESDPRRFAATGPRERGLVSEPAPPKKRRRIWLWIGLAVCSSSSSRRPGWRSQLLSVRFSELRSRRCKLTPPRSARVPNVIGMKACKAVRSRGRTQVSTIGASPGTSTATRCDLIVVGQSPVGHVIRRDGHPVIVTLRLGRS